MIIIAHNIRSLYNVGAIFRNAAAFNVKKVHLTGFTGTPPRKEIAKVALGAQDLVDWEKGEAGEVIIKLKKDGFSVYGLETGEKAQDIASFKQPEKFALVLGNEVEGINDKMKNRLDGLLKIPMGKKRSLNVAVASGIAIYTLGRGRPVPFKV